MTDHTITFTLPSLVNVGKNGVHGSLDVDWGAVPQHVIEHIGRVHFPQYLSDSFNSGGKIATSAERLASAEKKLAQMMAGELRTRGTSSDPIDPAGKEAYSEARKALSVAFTKEGLFRDIPKGTKNRFEYVLNRAQAAQGMPETSDTEFLDDFLANTDIGKEIMADAVNTIAKRDRLAAAAGIPEFPGGKKANTKPPAKGRKAA